MPRPMSSRTRTETRLASGATPAMRPPEWLPLPTMMPATWVPWPLGSTLSSGGAAWGLELGDDVHHRGQGLEVRVLGDPRVDDGDGHACALDDALRHRRRGLVGRFAGEVHGRHDGLVDAHVVHDRAVGEGGHAVRGDAEGQPARLRAQAAARLRAKALHQRPAPRRPARGLKRTRTSILAEPLARAAYGRGRCAPCHAGRPLSALLVPCRCPRGWCGWQERATTPHATPCRSRRPPMYRS